MLQTYLLAVLIILKPAHSIFVFIAILTVTELGDLLVQWLAVGWMTGVEIFLFATLSTGIHPVSYPAGGEGSLPRV
jgi:hypothetical protein